MKNLILARHGEYSRETLDLLPCGREAMASLGKVISARVKGEFYIGSSGVKRADQSAEILREILGAKQKVKLLECLNYQRKFLDNDSAEIIYDEIEKLKLGEENLVLVTHMGVITGLPNYIAERRRGWADRFYEKVDKSQAVRIDLEARTFQLLTPYMDYAGE